MIKAICNTSPLLYLHLIGKLDWLPEIFDEVWTSNAMVNELLPGELKGYNVPNPNDYEWLQIVEPNFTPSEWLVLDLGTGELSVMSLALEHPNHIIILDDVLARTTARSAGLHVWGTLRILLEAKDKGFTARVEPYLTKLEKKGLWLSDDIKKRVLILANENI